MGFQNFEEKEYVPMLLKDIKSALDNNLYLVALVGALTIPDILAKVEFGPSGRENYAEWVDKYVYDEFGCSYGERLQAINRVNHKEDETVIGEKEKYQKSPTIMCGQNCYQLRCSILHDGTNEIKGNGKSGQSGKHLFIDECVLELTEDEALGVRNGADFQIEKRDDGSIVWKLKKFCYIDVRTLCNDIVRAAEEYIKKDYVRDQLPKIKVNSGGGRINPLLDAKSCNEHYALIREISSRK